MISQSVSLFNQPAVDFRENPFEKLPEEVLYEIFARCANPFTFARISLRCYQIFQSPGSGPCVLNLFSESVRLYLRDTFPPGALQLATEVQMKARARHLEELTLLGFSQAAAKNALTYRQTEEIIEDLCFSNFCTKIPGIGDPFPTGLIHHEAKMYRQFFDSLDVNRVTELNAFQLLFSRVPADVGVLTGLTNLSLCNQTLHYLPSSIKDLKKLNLLNLFNNRFLSLPTAICHLESLQELDLTGNKIASLTDLTSNLQNLQILHLNENNFSHLPKCVCKLAKLRELHLARNQLTSLPKSISKLTNLTYLNLSGNHLSSLPDTIGDLPELHTLNLWKNALTSLPSTLTKLQSLRILYLNENPSLNPLPPILEDLPLDTLSIVI